jgi:hypothetical protein
MGCSASRNVDPDLTEAARDTYTVACSVVSRPLSGGVETPEPDPQHLRQYVRSLVSFARRLHGITRDPEQFTPAPNRRASPQQMRAVEQWIDETTTPAIHCCAMFTTSPTPSSAYLDTSARSDLSLMYSVTLLPGAVHSVTSFSSARSPLQPSTSPSPLAFGPLCSPACRSA